MATIMSVGSARLEALSTVSGETEKHTPPDDRDLRDKSANREEHDADDGRGVWTTSDVLSDCPDHRAQDERRDAAPQKRVEVCRGGRLLLSHGLKVRGRGGPWRALPPGSPTASTRRWSW